MDRVRVPGRRIGEISQAMQDIREGHVKVVLKDEVKAILNDINASHEEWLRRMDAKLAGLGVDTNALP